MGLKLSKIKRAARHYMSMKAARKKLGLTGSSRHFRQLKRSLKGYTGTVDTGAGVSSASSYQYQPRSISQLMGGV